MPWQLQQYRSYWCVTATHLHVEGPITAWFPALPPPADTSHAKSTAVVRANQRGTAVGLLTVTNRGWTHSQQPQWARVMQAAEVLEVWGKNPFRHHCKVAESTKCLCFSFTWGNMQQQQEEKGRKDRQASPIWKQPTEQLLQGFNQVSSPPPPGEKISLGTVRARHKVRRDGIMWGGGRLWNGHLLSLMTPCSVLQLPSGQYRWPSCYVAWLSPM